MDGCAWIRRCTIHAAMPCKPTGVPVDVRMRAVGVHMPEIAQLPSLSSLQHPYVQQAITNCVQHLPSCTLCYTMFRRLPQLVCGTVMWWGLVPGLWTCELAISLCLISTFVLVIPVWLNCDVVSFPDGQFLHFIDTLVLIISVWLNWEVVRYSDKTVNVYIVPSFTFALDFDGDCSSSLTYVCNHFWLTIKYA